MTSKFRIWAERILGTIEAVFLNLVGTIVVILFLLFYVMPFFFEYIYMKECVEEQTEKWCKDDWQEIDQHRKDLLKDVSDSLFH